MRAKAVTLRVVTQALDQAVGGRNKPVRRAILNIGSVVSEISQRSTRRNRVAAIMQLAGLPTRTSPPIRASAHRPPAALRDVAAQPDGARLPSSSASY